MKKILFGLLVIFVSCSDINDGVIVEKVYEPEDMFMVLMPMQMGESTMMMPMWMYDGEDFILKVKGVNKKGEPKKRTVYTSRDKFERFEIGDSICLKGECFKDNNNRKEKRK